jgi:hypothetical protein
MQVAKKIFKIPSGIFDGQAAHANVIYSGLIFLLTLFTYYNAFHSGFIGDDYGGIVDRESFFKQGLFYTLQEVLPDRPFLMLTIWLNFKFFGIEPLSYKIVNIFLHATCGISFFYLMSDFLRQHLNGKLIAFLSVCLFIAHPINNQAVMSAIQRGLLMSTLFSIWSFYFFVQFLKHKEKDTYYLFSILIFLLAMVSKPNTMILPLMMILYAVLILDCKISRSLKLMIPYCFIIAIPIFFNQVLKIHTQSNKIFSWPYLLVQSEVLLIYFSKYFYPVDLQFYYSMCNFDLERLVQNYQNYLLAGHVLLNLSCLYLVKTKKSMPALFVVFGYICFIPESSFFQILHPLFDHRNYWPVAFFIAVFVLLLFNLFKNNPRAKVALISASIISTLALAVTNINYTEKIETYEKWALYNSQKNPIYYKMTDYLVSQAMVAEKYDFAKKLILELQKANPDDRDLQVILPLTDYMKGGNDYKLSLLQKTYYAVFNRPMRSQFICTLEVFFKNQLFDMLEYKDALYKMNSFYFFYLDATTNLTSIDLNYSKRAEYSFLEVLKFNNRLDLNNQSFFENLAKPDAIRSLRALIALRYYFGYSTIDISLLKQQLLRAYPEGEETKSVLAWIDSLEQKPKTN